MGSRSIHLSQAQSSVSGYRTTARASHVSKSAGPASYGEVVTTEPFDACWLRLDRADIHRREAIEIWNSYYTEHPCQWSLDHEGDGVHILRVWRDQPMPAALAIVTGGRWSACCAGEVCGDDVGGVAV
jgi:hypothetical protein